MPVKREHWYNVAILSYNSPKTRAMAQRGEDIGSGRIRTRVLYSGPDWREARLALGQAVAKASRMKLSYAVHVLDNYEPIIRVNVEHLI
jgi:hypothetical protein